jgi:hypothetical protein
MRRSPPVLLRPIHILATPGSVVSAEAPAAMAAGNVETSQRITDVLLGALAQAIPDRIPAASSGTMNNLSFGGWDSKRNRAFAYYETVAGGMGAGPVHPGHSATHTHMTNSWNTPVEALEHQFPIRMAEYSIRRGSGGAGAPARRRRHRPSLGIPRACKSHYPFDRRERGPYGIAGGSPGATGRNSVLRGKNTTAIAAKTEFEVSPGDTFRIETPGGEVTAIRYDVYLPGVGRSQVKILLEHSVLLVFLCTLIGAAAQILLKMGANQLAGSNPIKMLMNPWLFCGYALYGISTILLILALRKGQLSVLYPVSL